MENKPWTEKGTLRWHWNKKIVPLKKNQTFCWPCGYVWVKLTTRGHAGLQNGVYVLDKATMYLFDLSAGSDQFLWTNMFCPLHFVSVEAHKVKKSPCSCQWMWKQEHTLKKKKRQSTMVQNELIDFFSCVCALRRGRTGCKSKRDRWGRPTAK